MTILVRGERHGLRRDQVLRMRAGTVPPVHGKPSPGEKPAGA